MTFPDTDGSVTLVAMGSYNVCAVLQHSDSQACSLFSWGKNRHGQLGLGDCVTRRTPTLVRALEKRSIISVSAGDYHSACVTNKGDVYIWGDNSQAQLGVETHGQISNFPIKVPGLRNVTQISCGGSHTAAITCTHPSPPPFSPPLPSSLSPSHSSYHRRGCCGSLECRG